ncbi:MAG: polysaccharide biosynthesis tyrosine autokinase [Anaerolineales bacterium]
MENTPGERTSAELISEYSSLLWQWSWLLILLALLAGGTAFFITKRQTPLYQTSTLVMVDGAPGSQNDPYSASIVGQALSSTYARVITTQPVLDSVAKKLGLPYFPATVDVEPLANTQLMTITVEDTDPDRAALLANTLVSVFANQIQADQTSRYADTKTSLESQMASLNQKIENTTNALTDINTQIQETNNALTQTNEEIQNYTVIITNNIKTLDSATIAGDQSIITEDQAKRDQLSITLSQYQPQLAQLQNTLSQYQQSYNNLFQSYQNLLLDEAQEASTFVQKDPAVPNRSPISPQPIRSALLAALVGLMAAAGIIFLVEFLDNTIRDPQDITRRWGIPIMGMIIKYKSSDKTKAESPITVRYPRSPVSEAFRSLRTNLQFASVDVPMHSLLVTSPSPSDGKSTVVANLASVIAQSGRNVVIVDADLRRPRIHKIFQLSNRSGLSDLFIKTQQDNFNGSLKNTEVANLSAITSGSLPPNPSELLSSGRMSEILTQLHDQFNTVILDSPPTLLVTDALVLASRVDGVLLVIKPSVTKWAAFRQAIEQLQQVKANLLGIIVNDVNVNHSRYYYYRGYYRQKYGKGYHYTENGPQELIPESKVAVSDTQLLDIKDENKKD